MSGSPTARSPMQRLDEEHPPLCSHMPPVCPCTHRAIPCAVREGEERWVRTRLCAEHPMHHNELMCRDAALARAAFAAAGKEAWTLPHARERGGSRARADTPAFLLERAT